MPARGGRFERRSPRWAGGLRWHRVILSAPRTCKLRPSTAQIGSSVAPCWGGALVSALTQDPQTTRAHGLRTHGVAIYLGGTASSGPGRRGFARAGFSPVRPMTAVDVDTDRSLRCWLPARRIDAGQHVGPRGRQVEDHGLV